MINALTWCVGMRKELEVEIATVKAKIAGSAPAEIAIEMTRAKKPCSN